MFISVGKVELVLLLFAGITINVFALDANSKRYLHLNDEEWRLVTAYDAKSVPCTVVCTDFTTYMICISNLNLTSVGTKSGIWDMKDGMVFPCKHLRHYIFRGFTDYDSIFENTISNSKIVQAQMFNVTMYYPWRPYESIEFSYNEFDILYLSYFSDLEVRRLTLIHNTITTLKNMYQISKEKGNRNWVTSLDLSYILIEVS